MRRYLPGYRNFVQWRVWHEFQSARLRVRKLRFKKSVFFHKNLLVCLGSNIKLTNGPGFKAQTTLFQDKLNRSASAFSIKVDGVSKGMTSTFLAMTPNNPSKGPSPTILLDTKGNSYYIPLSSAPYVKIHIQNQTSGNQKSNPSTGYYATAWFENSSVDASYEYAIYVNTPSYPHTAQDAWLLQEDQKKLYEVLKQGHKAHVVGFFSAPDSLTAINPRYGYVIFQPVTTLKCHCLRKCSRGQNLWSTDLAETWHRSWLP